MRKLKYLSPTSIRKFFENREEFYLQYLADNRPPKMKQTEPMSVGASFDAYVKCYLAEKLGLDWTPFEDLFEQQVEPQNRAFAREAGHICMEAYRASGALSQLMLEIEAGSEYKFETTVEQVIEGVPFLGKPDMHYQMPGGHTVVLDWKVNGYCSKSNTSPKKGYTLCLDGWESDSHSRSHNRMHKDCHILSLDGISYNAAAGLESIDASWAMQVCIYSWVLGCPIGSDFIVGIDQLACGPYGDKIRIAKFRNFVGPDFQRKVMMQAQECWERSQSVSTVFDTDSEARCQELDTFHEAYLGEDGDAFGSIL